MDYTTKTCIIFLIISMFLFYVIYKLLSYQNSVVLREGMESSGNCSVTDFKDKVSKALEKMQGTVDLSKKTELEEIITNMYDITNYAILNNLCSSDPSSGNVDTKTATLMQYSQGLQKLMSWLDSKSSTSSGTSSWR